METRKSGRVVRMMNEEFKYDLIEEREEEQEEDDDDETFGEIRKKKKALGKRGSGSKQPCCQVEECTIDMTNSKAYYRRHKVCEVHAKAPIVVINGCEQRFCQQCSRFHDLTEFDDTKKSCRRRLAGHNERRRKTSESYGESSG